MDCSVILKQFDKLWSSPAAGLVNEANLESIRQGEQQRASRTEYVDTLRKEDLYPARVVTGGAALKKSYYTVQRRPDRLSAWHFQKEDSHRV